MTCLHVNQIRNLKPAAAFSKIYKDECTLCFNTPESENGLNVCLTCFNGACFSNHSNLHYRKSGHCLALNIRSFVVNDDRGAKTKLVKVEIEELSEPVHEYNYKIKCLACSAAWNIEGENVLEGSGPVVQSIINAMAASKKVEVATWQEEVTVCEHSKTLQQQLDPTAAELLDKSKCKNCDLKQNLWMCLTCGANGCGRKQFDGTGGRGHGAQHFEDFKHPLAVKLGTITSEGDGDVHCYFCDEIRFDPLLAEHLNNLGIDVSGTEKSEQTMAELQLEQNKKFDFSMLSEEGKSLVAVKGPFKVGLKNLGNTCYVNSVVQSLFHLPEFKALYGESDHHLQTCHRDSSACVTCQIIKLEKVFLHGDPIIVSPWMFKSVISNGHSEFSSAKQQDASEFLAYFLKVLQRFDAATSKDLISKFNFETRQILLCSFCGDTKHQNSSCNSLQLQLGPVLTSLNDNVTLQDKLFLKQFLQQYFGDEEVESRCNKCGASKRNKSTQLLSYPKYLTISLSRYILRNWVPQKFDMAVEVPFDDLSLSEFKGEQISSMEESPEEPVVDSAILDELIAMGFSKAKCRMALIETGNSGLESAMNWVLENMDLELPEITEPLSNKNSQNNLASNELVDCIVDAGFSKEQATRALKETENDVERAFDWILNHPTESMESLQDSNMSIDNQSSSSNYRLVSFISHKGPSVHCGHYIAHVFDRDLKKWIMFNDERVVIADPQPPTTASEKGYIYFYERNDDEI